MRLDFWSWCKSLRRPPRRTRPKRRLALERLEDRTLLSLAAAVPLEFNVLGAARVADRLSTPAEADLFRVTLQPGDTIDASVSALSDGGGLASLLRIFDAEGNPLALNNQEGGDPQLRFQAAAAGDYFVGVSSAPNSNYNPTIDGSGTAGAVTGLYTLDVKLALAAPRMPDLTGSSFRLGVSMAAAGDRVPVAFAVENRGGADPGNFLVQVLLASNNLFGDSAQVLAEFQRDDLVEIAAGRTYLSQDNFRALLPAGLTSGPAFVGLRIVSDPAAPESNLANNRGVHAGADFEPLTIVTLAAPGVADLSQTDASLRTGTDGMLLAQDQVDTFSFTVTNALGSGTLIAEAAATSGNLLPRLTLSGPQGQVLIQSDGGRIVQYLQPGTYSLAVSAQSGTGGYRLSTAFNQTPPLLASLAAGTVTRAVAAGDLNLDGIMDVIAANFLDGTVSVLLGNGDGTFQPQFAIAVGPGPASVTVADVNGVGKPDLLTPNKFNATVSVMLGNGDGTFQPEAEFDVGLRPGGVAVADMDGDGRADLAVSNYRTANVSVLLGNGDGTFQPQQTFDTDFGPGKVEAADVNGDGIPDLITPNYSAANVSVLLGNGDGTFHPHLTFATGRTPYSVAVADVNGDGKLDLVTSNFGDNSVSVLLGKGDGSFGQGKFFPAGKSPRIAAVSDLNGNGKPDIVTANVGDNSVSVLLGRGDGTFQAQQAAPAPAPGLRPFSVALADLNGDGRRDLVTANKADNSVSVLLRNSDGAFQTKQTFPTGPNPNAVAAADVSGDGIPDLVTANYTDSSVSVLLGNGDGTFGSPTNFAAGNTVYAVTVADVNGDGRPDIITANKGDDAISVLLNNGNGTFQTQRVFAAGRGVDAVTVADLNGDGKRDIAAANFGDNSISLLFGDGNGNFQPQPALAAGSQPSVVRVADVNGDGNPDLVATNYGDSRVSVLLGDGAGAFQAHQDFATGANPEGLELGDFNGDTFPDIATANFGSGDVSLLLNNGDGTGTFGDPQHFSTGSGTSALALADVNGDGSLDVAATSRNDGTVSVLRGDGHGGFQPRDVLGLGKNRYSAAVADVNGDGKPDILKSNLRDDTVSVELGNGTGTFEPGQILPVGPQPTRVILADLNGDGRLDLVTANSGGDSVSVLLGNGDGTFNAEQRFATGRSPRAVAIADVNGDGILDLSVANYNDGSVSVLLGNGDGTFGGQQVFAVGQRPYSLAVADMNGDGRPDLVAANAADDTVSVLRGNGNGTFQAQQTFPTGRQPFAVAVADVNGDAIPDVMTANAFDNTVSVLLGIGNGTLAAQQVFAAGRIPSSLAVGDVNGDGELDLVTADYGDNSASVLLGDGLGSFQKQALTTSLSPVLTVTADVNGDGRPDLVTVGNHDNTTGVLLNKGQGVFQPATAATAVELCNKPFLVDLNGDGIADRIVLDRSGNILFRKGLPGGDDIFAPPRILNPGRPVRDITVLRTGAGLAIAAADARFDPVLSVNQFVFTVSLYTVGANGLVTRRTAFSTTALPARLAAAQLTDSGRDDLIAANALDNSVTIALQTAPGVFAAPVTMAAGIAPSDIAVADLNGDNLLDVAVSDQASGDVSILLNDALHSFTRTLRFRASTEPGGLDTASGSPVVSSLAQSVSLAAGDFTGSGQDGLAVVNRGAHSFTVLSGNGNGGLANPQLGMTTSTSDGLNINERPGAAAAGDFNRDGNLDLAILMEDAGQVWIYSGNGTGAFSHTFTIPAGDQATGLSVVAGDAPGLLDLLVGNGFGDVLHLEGKGDGTFQISGSRVSLSVVADLLGPGLAGVLVGNQQDNRVTVQGPTADGNQFAAVATLASAQMAPGDVQWFVLDRDAALPDAVVVSTGSNAVVVYRTTAITNGVPVFAESPQTLFVGTAPASVTVADLNGDAIADMLIANQGSNDVSVVFGAYDDAGAWVGTLGPRLKSGGAGPLAAALREMNGDGITDLVVTNGVSGTLTMLPGVGQGFFDDRSPETLFDLGGAVVQPPTFTGGSGVGFAVTAGGELVRFDLADPDAGARVVFAGQGVLAARALATGQVVVALAGGAVNVLTAQGENLSVAAVLQAQAGVPALPSALEVLQTPGGQLQVLVSSQGSDTIFVFELAGGGQLPPVGGGGQPVAVQPPVSAAIALGSGISASISGGIDSASASIALASSNLAGLSVPLGSTAGLAISGFAPDDAFTAKTESVAALTPVQGNAYALAAVLDFGSQSDDDPGDDRNRMPWLSSSYPIGDTSPLTRFVIGQEEALKDYRGSEDAPLPGDADAPLKDPWTEDLFHRRTPSGPPIRGPENEEQESGIEEQPPFECFWENCAGDPSLLPSAVAGRKGADFEDLTILLAGLLLAQAARIGDGGCSPGERKRIQQESSQRLPLVNGFAD